MAAPLARSKQQETKSKPRAVAWRSVRREQHRSPNNQQQTIVKLIINTIAIVALSCSVAFARIGETYTEAVQRYGKEIQTYDPPGTTNLVWFNFAKGNFRVNAVFGPSRKIVAIEYVKIGEDGWVELSVNERENFLKSNRSKGWHETKSENGSPFWSNGNLCAIYSETPDTGYKRLLICTTSFLDDRLKIETADQEGF